MSMSNCPSCKHWIFTGWGGGMCNLGIGYCRYEMKDDLEPGSLYPYTPSMPQSIINPGLEKEINKQTKLLENILDEMKEIKHLLLAQNTKVERILDPDDRIEEIYNKHSDLITTPPGFKAPDISCSAKEEESDEN